MFRRTVSTFAVLLSLTAAVLLTSPEHAAAAEISAPPVIALDDAEGSVTDMVVDDVHQRLYMSRGKYALEVTDYSGVPTSGEVVQGAGALAIARDTGTVFVAEETEHAIGAASTATEEVGRDLDIGAGVTPLTLAYGNGRVWFGYRAADGTNGVGSVDPSTEPATVDLHAVAGSWHEAPELAADDTQLITADGGDVSAYTLSGGQAALRSSRTVSVDGHAADAALTSDGTAVLVPGISARGVTALATDDLHVIGSYDEPATAVSVAADGSVATGDGSTLTLHSPGSFSASDTLPLAAPTVVTHGLAWSSDRSHLFAVTADPTTGRDIGLTIHYNPELAPSRLSVTATADDPVTLVGRLTIADTPAPDRQVRVRRDGTDLGDATTDADGSFTVKDPGATPGTTYDYIVDFAGDDSTQPAVARVPVTSAAIPTGMTLTSATSRILGGDYVDLRGRVSVGLEGFDFGQLMLSVRVVGPDAPNGRNASVLPELQGDTFQVGDLPGKAGTYTYTLRLSGPATIASTEIVTTVSVERAATGIALTQNRTTALPGDVVTMQGKVSFAGSPYTDMAWLKVQRYSPQHPTGENLPDIDAGKGKSWAFTFTDAPTTPGSYRYVFSFPGNRRYAPAVAQSVLTVARGATTLSLSSTATRYAYGAHGTVTVHLGAHLTGGTVSIWAQPSGSANVLVKKAAVDAKGNLTVPYTFTRNTVFRASYSGDLRYAAVSAAPRTVTTSARLSTALHGWYTTSGGWRVYHRSAKKQLSVALAAPQPGKCVRITVQQYVSGHWKTVRSTTCTRLGAQSTLLWTLPFATPVGAKYRIAAASYAGPNPAATGPWLYFTVRK